ncbi:unnamed protein product [Euphydryas editha]|uniref:Gustatory receptor n=1 Tax=Euphydryas editha TaxID=104508 RepID=A0AAU9ULG3_EUPED|nr:unnamed protein product [Euphydryas editha]
MKENDDHDNDTRVNLDNSNISRWRHFKPFFIFLFVHLITNVQFLRLSTKWHHVMEQVAKSKLDEYVDPYVKFKCNLATILLLTFSFLEHLLSVMCPFLKLKRKCCLDLPDILKILAVNQYPWIFTVVPYSHGAFIIVEILTLIITMIWTYSHVLIICISLFLASILEQLNKKITSRENRFLPASYWRTIREDYNRAIRLVRFFDDSINGIAFVTFGCSLFFVCGRLYEVLGKSVVYENSYEYKCLKEENWYGYEDFIYNLISTLFVIIRAFLVSLLAAKIHSASLVVAPSLYNVPQSSFSTEIQRFLNQIHGTTVALTGLNFFYVTKESILSMIGTVVTYELVLLQFRRDDENK